MIGLAPMDGITDAAYRQIVDRYGHADLLFTEFTNINGLILGKSKIYNKLVYHQTKTPTIAQLFGRNLDYFYQASLIVCALGFDGVDINMGCPDKNVVKKGGGAGLIKEPKLAQIIIATVKRAVKDWSRGADIDGLNLKQETSDWIRNFQRRNKIKRKKKYISVSVKTRLGYDKIITREWVKYLIDKEPDFISLHARTLKQMYSGKADWEEIGKAVVISKGSPTQIIGNGDIRSKKDAEEKIREYKVKGVLIGRAALGNPWVFQDYQPSDEERFRIMLEHCQAFTKLTPELNFLSLRKHLLWYLKGIDNSHRVKKQLAQVKDITQVRNILANYSVGQLTS